MRNYKQCVLMIFFTAVISTSCTKENIAPSTENNNQQNAVSQSVVYNNVTINPSGNHVFSVPYLTQAVINKGTLTVYAASASTPTAQWQLLNSCEAHMDITSITVGNVEIQNNMGAAVSMSFRFDVPGN
jgi:hypothetical protein